MMKLFLDQLFAYEDKAYALFQSKLTPGIDPDSFIGVRVPDVRSLAKTLYKNNNEDVYKFFLELPHKYYDENMLHGLLIAEIKDFKTCIVELERFLPYVDNWAVCDIMSPKCLKKHKEELVPYLQKWMNSNKEYTIRFALEMLMSFYLDEDFKEEYLDLAATIRSDKYYVNMMIAWLFATALAKQWSSTIKYIEKKRLDSWAHNKTIQKARESYRISDEQKEYLKQLKVSS